jgi:hypothetical protein
LATTINSTPSEGPGGALTALTARHPDRAWTLNDNLRQTDPGEQAALTELRAGDPARAVAWYVDHDRVHPADSRTQAIQAMVEAWAADTARGADTLLLAYRRHNVDALNLAARRLCENAGMLSGPELTAPSGKRYRTGDRIIAPGPRGSRRGRAQISTATEGLTWATSWHATTRAGDPQVHDHVCSRPLSPRADAWRCSRGYSGRPCRFSSSQCRIWFGSNRTKWPTFT